MIATNSTAMSALMSLSIMESRYPVMRLRIWAFLSWAIKRSDPRGPASRERGVKEQDHAQDDANDRHQEANADTLRLPPKNVGQHRASELQSFDVVDVLSDGFKILRREISSDEETLGAALGIARNEHHEQKEVDDQERQQHQLDRQVFWKGRVIPENRTHHERNEQERDVRLEIARPDRFGITGDQTAISLRWCGKRFVHPTFGRPRWARRKSPSNPVSPMNPASSNTRIALSSTVCQVEQRPCAPLV